MSVGPYVLAEREDVHKMPGWSAHFERPYRLLPLPRRLHLRRGHGPAPPHNDALRERGELRHCKRIYQRNAVLARLRAVDVPQRKHLLERERKQVPPMPRDHSDLS